MMHATRTYLRAAAVLLLGFAANLAHAAQGDDFLDRASANGIAEIETARMALETSQAEDVRAFAQRMLDDHTKSRQDMARLAKEKNLQIGRAHV